MHLLKVIYLLVRVVMYLDGVIAWVLTPLPVAINMLESTRVAS